MNPNPILFQLPVPWAAPPISTSSFDAYLGFKRSVDNPLELEYAMIYYKGCWTMTGLRTHRLDDIIDFAKESNIVIEHEYGKLIFHSEEDLFWILMRFV